MASKLRQNYKCIFYNLMLCSDILMLTNLNESFSVYFRTIFSFIVFIFCLHQKPRNLLMVTDSHPSIVLPFQIKQFRIKRGITDRTGIPGCITSIKDMIPWGEEQGNMKNILLQFQESAFSLEPAFSLENRHFCMLGDNSSFFLLSQKDMLFLQFYLENIQNIF